MSYQTGRRTIETYTLNNWDVQIPIGFDRQTFTPIHRSVMMEIMEGELFQGSIGAPGANSVYHAGVLQFTVYVSGGRGSDEWRAIADMITDLFFGITLDTDGLPIASPSQVAHVRFSPPEMGDSRHPKLASQAMEPPFLTAVIQCPFVRYERR